GVASTVYKLGSTVITSPYDFPVGVSTGDVTVTDTATPPNTATCSFTVTVNDTEKPEANCPAPIVVGNDVGKCTASVSFAASPTDNCGVASTVYKLGSMVITSPYNFPVGVSTVDVTETDTATPPNTATCSFTVTVNDTEKPVANCPAPIVVGNDVGKCTASVSFAASPTDNCGVASTVYKLGSMVITSPYNFPVGVSTVDVTVTDTATPPNTATCSFTV